MTLFGQLGLMRSVASGRPSGDCSKVFDRSDMDPDDTVYCPALTFLRSLVTLDRDVSRPESHSDSGQIALFYPYWREAPKRPGAVK
jgi:hypothetical protein